MGNENAEQKEAGKKGNERIFLGRWGENLAEEYLEERGYRTVERNFRCRSGEVDLVVKQGDLWVFVEVKTRRNNAYGSPGESVTHIKKQHFLKAVLYYSLINGIGVEDMRVDVVEICVLGCSAEINHIINAF